MIQFFNKNTHLIAYSFPRHTQIVEKGSKNNNTICEEEKGKKSMKNKA